MSWGCYRGQASCSLFRLAGPTKRLVEQRSDTSSRLWSDCFLCAELHIFPADSSLKIAANQEPSHFNKWIHFFLISLLSAWPLLLRSDWPLLSVIALFHEWCAVCWMQNASAILNEAWGLKKLGGRLSFAACFVVLGFCHAWLQVAQVRGKTWSVHRRRWKKQRANTTPSLF